MLCTIIFDKQTRFVALLNNSSPVFYTDLCCGKFGVHNVLDNGAEVLMHIGMDTVELNGEGFDLDVSVGDEVHAGELMGSIDLDFVKSKGKETVTPIVLTAMDEYKIEFVKTEGHVNIGDVLYKISK